MSLLSLVIALLGIVGVFISGMNYKRDGEFYDIVLGIMCSYSAVYQLIRAYMGG